VEKEVCLIPLHLEGGAVVHYQGLYYAIGSALTAGVQPHKYATAKSLEGPWSSSRYRAAETKTTERSPHDVEVVGKKRPP